MHTRKLIFLLPFLLSTFAFTSFVQAHGDDGNYSDMSKAITNFQDNNQSSHTSSHAGMDHSSMNHEMMDGSTMSGSTMDHSEMDQSSMNHEMMDDSTMNDATMDHSTMDHGTMNHSGHDAAMEIENTPPNYKVLGTFAGINFGFLGLGAILKLRKRKEYLYEVK